MKYNEPVPILELKNISAQYGSIRALKNLDLKVNSGEIHAVVGEHGAGKSTIAKIVANLMEPSAGTVLVKGKPLSQPGFKNAMDAGIRMVFQKLQLNDGLSVADNLFLNNNMIFKSPFNLYSGKKVEELAKRFFEENNISLNPSKMVSRLELPEKALLSILRNIYNPPELLILDEVLEKLSAKGFEQVITWLNRLRDNGSSVLFITHRIDDLYTLADRVSIIRKGEVLLSEEVSELDKISLIKMAYTQFTSLEKSSIQAEEFNKLIKYNNAVLKELPLSLIVTNHENKIKLINKDARKMFGRDDLIELQVFDLFAENPEIIEILKKSFSDSEMHTKYNIPLIIGADLVRADIIVYPIREEGNYIGSMLIIEDNTERENLREQLILSEKLASIGLLAAGVAHEINNPLGVISNYLESFKRNKIADENKEQVIEYLFEQVEYITQVISNLIVFSENKQQLTERVEVVGEIKKIIDLISYGGKQSQILIRMDAEKSQHYIRINRNEFKQVVINLFKNAFEAMPSGGSIAIEINSISKAGTPHLLITFTDTGPGISYKDPNDVFLPFKSTKNTGDNFGMGLSICYTILNRYNGEIAVNSAENEGTVFRITIPESIEE